MSSKLRIRIGEVEIDYEGTEEFLKQELPQLLKTAMELHKASGVQPAPKAKSQASGAGEGGGPPGGPTLTTNSIAAKLNAKSGSDLLKAAAAHLALVKKTEPFTRQQLLTEMKGATSYYQANYSTNLSSYIKTAIQKDGPLSENAANSFALKATARTSLEALLANQ